METTSVTPCNKKHSQSKVFLPSSSSFYYTLIRVHSVPSTLVLGIRPHRRTEAAAAATFFFFSFWFAIAPLLLLLPLYSWRSVVGILFSLKNSKSTGNGKRKEMTTPIPPTQRRRLANRVELALQSQKFGGRLLLYFLLLLLFLLLLHGIFFLVFFSLHEFGASVVVDVVDSQNLIERPRHDIRLIAQTISWLCPGSLIFLFLSPWNHKQNVPKDQFVPFFFSKFSFVRSIALTNILIDFLFMFR